MPLAAEWRLTKAVFASWLRMPGELRGRRSGTRFRGYAEEEGCLLLAFSSYRIAKDPGDGSPQERLDITRERR